MPNTLKATITATVPLPASTAFQAWIDPVLLPQWLAPPPYNLVRADVEPSTGGHYHHDTSGPDGDEHVVQGEYSEFLPGKRLKKTWNYSGPNPAPRPEATYVEVDFHEQNDGATTVTITHSGLRDETEFKHYSEGWAHCLERLKKLPKQS